MLRLLVSAAARRPFHPCVALLAALALASSEAEAAPDKAAPLVEGRYEIVPVVAAITIGVSTGVALAARLFGLRIGIRGR